MQLIHTNNGGQFSHALAEKSVDLGALHDVHVLS